MASSEPANVMRMKLLRYKILRQSAGVPGRVLGEAALTSSMCTSPSAPKSESALSTKYVAGHVRSPALYTVSKSSRMSAAQLVCGAGCGFGADLISTAYSGTGALKTDFTRTGKRTLAGRSLVRLIGQCR